VPERRSKIYTNKISGANLEFTGEFPQLYVWKKHCV